MIYGVPLFTILVVGTVAAISIGWAQKRCQRVWLRLGERKRLLLRCLAIAALWSTIKLLTHNKVKATWITIVVAFLWFAYYAFTCAMDSLESGSRRS